MMTNIQRRLQHYALWNTLIFLSNIPVWWSIFFKPMQRAASVAATKELFTPNNDYVKKVFSKYGINTKASLELGSVLECLYKNSDLKTCITTATTKYSTSLLCEFSAIGIAPSYIVKPTCFALGTLISSYYKASLHNNTLTSEDAIQILISSSARTSEHFLPQQLANYGVPFDCSFYFTTFIEGLLSLTFKQYTENKNSKKLPEEVVEQHSKKIEITPYTKELINRDILKNEECYLCKDNALANATWHLNYTEEFIC